MSLFVIFSALLSACQPAPAPTEPPAPPTPQPAASSTPIPAPTDTPAPAPEPTVDLSTQLADTQWLLVAFGEAANPAVVEKGTAVTALFASDGTLSGSGGCNNYFSTYKLEGEKLTVADPIGSTMMFCDKGMEQESAFLTALQSAGRIAFTAEGRLEVFYDLGSSVERKMVFVPGETSLADTVWTLQKMGSAGDPAAVESGVVVTAMFSQEGSLSGTSGCNNYAAGFTLEDDRITIEHPISTLKACETGMDQETAYLQALASAETYQITGGSLEIAFDGGAGVLVYTSRNLPLENILWTLVMINDAPSATGLTPTTLLFDPGSEKGQGSAGGVAMCNNYRGGYTVEGDQLSISALASTLISCPESVWREEATYFELLETAKTYQILGQTLIITSEKGQMTFAANRAPLEGTNWRLTALGSTEHPQMPVAGADFTAEFVRQPGLPSGLMVGGTGCNDYNAVYAASLNEIKINTPSRSQNTDCAADLSAQETLYFQALNTASSYRILGDTLQIFYGEGEALSFTAFVPSEPLQSGGPLSTLNGTRWWLVSMRNVVLRPGSVITADFAVNADGVTGSVGGVAGCNNYTAPILDFFQVGPPVSTKKFCPEPLGVMEQEADYLAMLGTANRISWIQNQLVIGAVGGLLVYYNRPLPVAPVEPPVTPTPTAAPEQPTATPVPTEAPIPTEAPPVEPVPPIATLPPITTQPQAVIHAPEQGEAGQVIIFDASRSEPAGWLASYTWNFEDGTYSEGVLVEHVFAAPGVYTVRLTVVDFYGQTSTQQMTITIQ